MNREGRPAGVKIAPKVVGRAAQASVKLMVSPRAVTFMGMPIMVVAMMPIRIAPFTLHTSRMMVSTRPMTNSHRVGLLNLASSGTMPEVTTLAPSSPTEAPVKETTSMFSRPM